MTRLLISVKDANEAALALEAGADCIDVKDPASGSLGAASHETVVSVVQIVARRVPVSAALGELSDEGPGCDRLPCIGLNYAKLGLAGCAAWPQWSKRWEERLSAWPQGIARVAVAYADWHEAACPPPREVLQEAIRLTCSAMLLDTCHKQRGGLFETWTGEALADFIDSVRQARMQVVLGGSLTADSLPRALALRPDFVAVRGAACAGTRDGRLEAWRVRKLAECVRKFS